MTHNVPRATLRQTIALNSEIRGHLARCGLRQVHLAAALDITQPQASQRLRGLIDWRYCELLTVAKLVGVRLVDLIQPRVV